MKDDQEQGERWIEETAEAVHQAYLDTCARLGWAVKPENQVPYAELAEDSKELDRASVRAVLARQTERQQDSALLEAVGAFLAVMGRDLAGNWFVHREDDVFRARVQAMSDALDAAKGAN